MRIEFLFVGSTKNSFLEEATRFYVKRLSRFARVQVHCTPNLKGIKNPDEQCHKEALQVLKVLKKEDYMILLDEKGATYTSSQLANRLQQHQVRGINRIFWVICGAHGAHSLLRERANEVLSLSSFTFSHQLARPILAEQVYRCFSIINNHPYHNEG